MSARKPIAVSSGQLEDPVLDRIISHVERVGAHGVPTVARSAAAAFIADTFAVGIAGSAAPWRGEILDMLTGIDGAGESTVFGSGERLPLIHAAMLNAYQIHAQEFDCVHERAVVHPMAGGAANTARLGRARGRRFRRAADPRDRCRRRRRGDIGTVFARSDAVLSAGQCVGVWRNRRSCNAGRARPRAAA